MDIFKFVKLLGGEKLANIHYENIDNQGKLVIC